MKEDFFNKIFVPLTLFVRFERVVQGLLVRGCWRPNRTEIFWPPLLWPSTLCLSRFLMLNQRPWGPLCWVLAFFTASYQHLLWTPTHQGLKAPSAWCGFPYHISSPTGLQLYWLSDSTGNSTGSSNSTELYNRSTLTQSLKPNV